MQITIVEKEFNVGIVEKFIAYCTQILHPCFDHYHKQFLDTYGYLYRIQNYATAANMLDPFVLRGDIIKRLCA